MVEIRYKCDICGEAASSEKYIVPIYKHTLLQKDGITMDLKPQKFMMASEMNFCERHKKEMCEILDGLIKRK